MRIEENNNQSKVLIKFVSTLTYDIDLEDQEIDYINKVEKIFGKIF